MWFERKNITNCFDLVSSEIVMNYRPIYTECLKVSVGLVNEGRMVTKMIKLK